MKVAVMGCGVVGSGVVEIISEKKELLLAACGEEVELKYVLDLRDFKGSFFEDKVIHDVDIIVKDKDVGVVAETMGGLEPAFTFVKKCLEAGKSVVTSNKELVAVKGNELFDIARKNNVAFMFEAAVCGGIPVIRTMFSSLAANNIKSFAGILNGTTNFILTKMINEKMSFEKALELAQSKGFAEKDPTADVDGIDACRKTCILASIAFGSHFLPDEIKTEGIRSITVADAAYAKSCGCKIKLLGRGEKTDDGKIFLIVAPAFVSSDSLIYGVEGVNNALSVVGDSTGEILLYGAGAGKEATASAVCGDILECIRVKAFEEHYSWGAHKDNIVSQCGEMVTRLYVRGYAKNRSEAIEKLRESFDGMKLLTIENAPENEIGFITGEGVEKELLDTLSEIRDLAAANIIRIL